MIRSSKSNSGDEVTLDNLIIILKIITDHNYRKFVKWRFAILRVSFSCLSWTISTSRIVVVLLGLGFILVTLIIESASLKSPISLNISTVSLSFFICKSRVSAFEAACGVFDSVRYPLHLGCLFASRSVCYCPLLLLTKFGLVGLLLFVFGFFW